MFGILEAVSVPNTGVFPSMEELLRALNERMEKEGYKIVKSRSHRGRVGGADVPGNGIIRCDLVCNRGGRPYRCTATKHKTSTKKTDCPWRAKAVHRKTVGGWVLTVSCDQHNHEPGTPEPPTPTEASEDENNDAEAEDDDPRPDVETSAALQVAGVSETALRLTGDTFQQFKTDYRKMPQSERLGLLSQLQLRIAAIYAIQNEDLQRTKRLEAQQRRHQQIEEGKRETAAHRNRAGQQPRRSQPGSQAEYTPEQQLSLPGQHNQGHHGRGQTMMQQSPFYMHHSTESILPVPGIDMPDLDHLPEPPNPHHPAKRIRGHRQPQAAHQTTQ